MSETDCLKLHEAKTEYILKLEAALAEKEREKDELLANQRRRMGAEYDELNAELKRVRIVAVEKIAALTARCKELEKWAAEHGLLILDKKEFWADHLVDKAAALAEKESENSLSPAETERLAILMEEMAESIQVIGKILRHGYESYHPKDLSKTSNRALLSEEIGHVRFIVGEMCACGDISGFILQSAAEKKRHSILPYLHHNVFRKEA